MAPTQQGREAFARAKKEEEKPRFPNFLKYEKHVPFTMSVVDMVPSLEPGKIERAKNYNEQRHPGSQRCAIHRYVNHSSDECHTLLD